MRAHEEDVPHEGTERVRNIIRGIGSLTAQSTINTILGFVLITTLLRLLPLIEYGAYSSVQTSLSIAGALSTFGLNAAIVRHMSLGSQGQDGHLGWGAAKASLIMTLALTSGVSLAFILAAPLLSTYFMKSTEWTWVFWLGALWLFSGSLSATLQGLVQGSRKYSLLAKILLYSRFIAVAFAVIGLSVYSNVFVAILSWVIFAILIGLWTLKNVWKPLIHSNAKGQYTEILRYSTPLGLAGFVGVVASNADLVVVGGYLDPLSLGIFNAAVTIASHLSSLLVVPLSTALFAEVSSSSRIPEEVSAGSRLAMRFMILTVLPASLLAASLSSQLVLLLSGKGEYASGIPALRLISSFYIFQGVQIVMLSILQGIGKSRSVLVVGALTAITDIVFSITLVPRFGLLGAAASRVAVMVFGSIVSLYFLREYLKGFVDRLFLAKGVVASLAPSIIVLILSSQVSDSVLTLVPYSLIAAAVFLVSIKSMSVLNDNDRRLIEHLLPGKLRWVARHL